jgi:sulfite exporter TauE/SafE
MTLIEQISNPYLGSLIVGFVYGVTFCTTACLPYIISYLAGIKSGYREAVIVTFIYNSGRIVAYAIVGTVIALFANFFESLFFNYYEKFSSIIFGSLVVLIGLSILLKKNSNSCSLRNRSGIVNNLRMNFDLRAFFMGVTRGFVLCPALIATLLYMSTQTEVNLTLIAIFFGLGTSISPLFFFAGAVAWLLEKAPLFRKWISIFCGLLLIILGCSVSLLAIVELL